MTLVQIWKVRVVHLFEMTFGDHFALYYNPCK